MINDEGEHMLAIVLQILKILGIIILVLLGILVSLILVALFVPVRYQAKGYYYETYEVRAKVTWLLHIVSAQVVYSKEQALLIIVKLFGITVFHNQKKKPEKLQEEEAEWNGEEVTEGVPTQSEEQTKSATTVTVQPHTRPRQVKNSIQEKPIQEMDEGEEHKLSIWDKLRVVIEKFIQQVVNIKYTIRKIYATINKVKENITYYMQLLQEDSTKEAILLCKKQLLRMFKNVKPKVFVVHVHLGMEDSPDTLGQILAIWGMLYPIHKGNIAMQAEFDKTVMEGDFLMKGRITLYVYLWAVYLFLFDKNMQRVKKSLLREEL